MRRFTTTRNKAARIAKKKILIPCSSCVGWCESVACQDRFVREHEEDEQNTFAPKRVSVKRTASVQPKDWKEYFFRSGFEDETHQFKRFLSENLTYSMTAALHVQNTTRRIDIVGARAEAYSPPWVWRELVDNTMKANGNLVIRFIGPQIPRSGVVEEDGLRLEYIQSTYHEDPETSLPPDVVFLFNPGLSFSSDTTIRDVWIPSIRKIKSLNKDVRVISSAYDLKDLSEDIIALETEGIRVTKPELNPFGGLRLWKNPTHTTQDAVQFARTNWATYSWVK